MTLDTQLDALREVHSLGAGRLPEAQLAQCGELGVEAHPRSRSARLAERATATVSASATARRRPGVGPRRPG